MPCAAPTARTPAAPFLAGVGASPVQSALLVARGAARAVGVSGSKGGSVRTVTILGGAGDMGRVVARDLAARRNDIALVLADLEGAKAERVAASLETAQASALAVDIFDPGRLREAVRGSALVVNATGPGFRTGPPVLEACLDERVAYLDLGDDFEAADVLLAHDRAARDGGVSGLVCARLTPGLWNVVVRSMVERLDRVERIAVAWVTGPTPKREGVERGGRAVLEHMLHACCGMTVGYSDGRRRMIPAFRHSERILFPAPLGESRVYDLGHAELATFPRTFPGVREVRTLGGLHPPFLNGVFQGVAASVVAGRVAWDDALDALLALDDGRTASSRARRAALHGVATQWLRGELGLRDAAAALSLGPGARRAPAGGLFARVAGVRGGAPCALEAIEAAGDAEAEGAMDELTGGCAALFVEAFLDGEVHSTGIAPPETALAPEAFLARARRRFPGLGLAVHE